MMSFYEELGIRKEASLEEIRQAYKALARVLHPDSQIDEKLKVVAALQMKRLHEMLDVLTDPQKRRAYDADLAAAAFPNTMVLWPAPEVVAPPEKASLAQSAIRYWSWILVGCMILGSGVWCMTARGPAPQEASIDPAASPLALSAGAPEAPAVRESAPKPHVFSPPHNPSESLVLVHQDPPKPVEIPAPPVVSASSPAPGAVYAARVAEAPPPETVPPAPSARSSTFAGEWFYVPSIEKPDPSLYAPLDIDLTLTEKDGLLSGEYRGEYKVPDAALSQNVVFKVQGKSPGGTAAALHWASGDGAAGEIDLNLSQPNLMKVTWWATQLGRQPGLSSGAAMLLRQQAH